MSTNYAPPAPFEFPPIYSFPPFFTLQPHTPSRDKQVAAWVDLIRAYCTHHRVYQLGLNASTLDLPLFRNAALNRSVSRDMLHTLLTALVKADLAEWTTKGKTNVFVYWKSLGEWGDVLVAWAKDNGFANTVVTGYEVRLGDYVTDQEFYAMNEVVFAKVVAHLDHQRRIVMVNPSSSVDELGFKIIG
ncbi:hypothetical protein GGF32_001702 [Allomyces javanicus]|nr:hypothetical protein GGF32_001702 [Allomyces javanicus]